MKASDDPRKRALKVEHLLTMSAGIYCDDNDPKAPAAENTMHDQDEERNWYAFTLRTPMAAAPGATSVYCSGISNLISGTLTRSSGQPLTSLFRDLVADPLDMKRYAFFLQPTGEPYGGGGMYIEPLDFLKLGQMMLDGGNWRGRRVVSEEWSKRAGLPLTKIRDRGYGYQWWVNEYEREGHVTRAFMAGGNGGQIVMVVPELDLVIAFHGGNYNDRVSFVPQNEWVPNFILPAVDRELRKTVR